MENPPCRVIHFRNVANETTQEELVAAAAAFGPVEKVIMLKTKRQAMVQFRDIAGAVSFMAAYASAPLKISGRNVYTSFSRHTELAPVC